MTWLTDIQSKLQDTHAAIAKLERAVASDPQSRSLSAMARSLQKRQKKLESQFFAATEELGIDVCTYRLFTDEYRITMKAFTAALYDFQSLVSVVYNALKYGPKQRARISAEVARDTSFHFGYAFSGSLGIVLTLPNERLLLIDSEIDKSINTVFEMAKSQTPEDVLSFAKKLGLSPIYRMFQWAKDLADSQMNAHIEWRRGESIRAKLLIQRPEFERLRDVINETSDETTEEITLVGTLVGADVMRRTFHMEFEDGEEIRGQFENAISESHKAELPKRYKALILKTTKVIYSTEEERTSYHLVKLQESNQRK